MKIKHLICLLALIVFYNCSSTSNKPEFIKKYSGRYLYNADETIEVYFEQNELFMIWRGVNNIQPLKVNDTTFFVKEMNEKIYFQTNSNNQNGYIALVPKEENKPVHNTFRKLEVDEKIPSEYLLNNEFDKALEGYLTIQKEDSLNMVINERNLNKFGYASLRKKKYTNAINIFKVNVALYPASSNVYDSLGEAYRKMGDTVQAIVYYKKSLKLDSGNARAKRILKQLEEKE